MAEMSILYLTIYTYAIKPQKSFFPHFHHPPITYLAREAARPVRLSFLLMPKLQYKEQLATIIAFGNENGIALSCFQHLKRTSFGITVSLKWYG